MQLTFRDIEAAFGVEEKTLYDWLNQRRMPAVKADDQYYFNSAEILEWALKNRIPLTPGALKLCEKGRPAHEIITPALVRGGIHAGLDGKSREEAIGRALDRLPLPSHIQRAALKDILLSREQAGTTGLGEGIAVPHVKHPVVLAGLEPVIGLFFLEEPVDFGAFDGRPVHTLFLILSPSFKGHLSLLSRLAFCLQEAAVKSALQRRAGREEILAIFAGAEANSGGAS